MKKSALILRFFLVLVLALSGFALSGCASNETDNASARPWNSPYGWENGLGGMNDYNH